MKNRDFSTKTQAKKKLCTMCSVDITGSHANRKMCEECSIKRRKKPTCNLTVEQQSFVLNNYKKMMRKDLAKECGASRSSVNRFMRDYGIKWRHNKWENDQETVKKVLKCYYEYGRLETQKKFKDISIRSIIEKYRLDDHGKVVMGSAGEELGVHCRKWKFREELFVIRYKDVLKKEDISEFLNRSDAVRTFLRKRYQGNGKRLLTYGMPHRLVKNIVLKDVPTFKKPVGKMGYRMVCWIDIAEWFKGEDVNMLKLAQAMARFTMWLHGGFPITIDVLPQLKQGDS